MVHALLCAVTLASPAQPPVANPTYAEEKAGPFSYYLVPSDVVGFKDSPQGFQLTYDGALNNGFGEFQILAGAEPRPVNVRIKTLYKGCYPIPEFSLQRDGALYRVRMWAMPRNLDPLEDLIAFVEVTVSNPGKAEVQGGLNSAYSVRGERSRAALPCREWYRDRFMDTKTWKRDGGEPTHLAFIEDGYKNGKLTDRTWAYTWDPTTMSAEEREHGMTGFPLKPGESRRFVFKVPFVPIARSHAEMVDAVAAADPDKAFQQVVKFWTDIYDRATQIDVPEQKVNDTIKASLAYMMIARDVLEDGKSFMQTCNKFQYHDFYFRDCAYFARSYNMMNLPDVSRGVVDYYLHRDETGKPVDLKKIGVDDWGQSIWALSQHFRLSGDLAFAKMVYPTLTPHMAWLQDRLAEDPLHLFPKCGPYDNELLDGHYTGHSFWVLLGLREAVMLANATGHPEDAKKWQGWHDAYRQRFMAQLKKMVAMTGGYIPPGIDKPEDGRDWENATGGVYPFGVLPPDNPWVGVTVRTVREYKWREGISTWGPNAWVLKEKQAKGLDADPGTLHHYQTYNTTETMLARGQQREVLEDVYSILAHTSSTHCGFEMSTAPWGARDTEGNYPPHGWAAARTVEMLRNMLVREVDGALHLASCLSPVWVQPGKTIRLQNARTNFGMVSYTVKSTKTGATVEFANKWRKAPKSVLFHTPWFVKVSSATVDGHGVAVNNGVLPLPPSVQRLVIRWEWVEKPDLSYARAVQIWLQKNYHRTPDTDLNFLFPHPVAPKLASPVRQFVGSYEVSLLNPSGMGSVYYTLDGREPMPLLKLTRRYSKPFRIQDTTRIRAICQWPDGRLSEPIEATIRKTAYANIAPASGPFEQGVKCEVYPGELEKLPDWTAQPARSFTATHFGVDEGKLSDQPLALRFTGVIDIPRDGVYTFRTGSDDGSRLWLGDRLVVENDGLHSYTEVLGDIALRKGRYPITVGFFDKGGARYLRVFWEGPGIKRARIPAEALSHSP